jgi:dihydrofolate synthase/folylpolyglutamate synthase
VKPTSHSSLQAWIDWLVSLHAEEIDLGIERVKSVAEIMGLLPMAPTVISVAGTNGKGSSVAMLNAIYQAAGFRTGVFTSPHLLRFNERILLAGHEATDQQIVDAFCAIEAARGQVKLTYFEFSTLAALWLFAQDSLDVVILEVGLGGRLDAVNLVDADASLITAIDVDHQDWLGSDRSQIAVEKAGIMRSGRPSVCSDADAPTTLLDYAEQHQVPLQLLGRDFGYVENDQAWSFGSEGSVRDGLPMPALKGRFQLQNAAGVLALIEQLQARLPVSDAAMHMGLETVTHAGRLQSIERGAQHWLVDVAHNPQAAMELARFLDTQPIMDVAIFSVLADKDALPMVQAVAPYVKKWAIADLAVPRAMSLENLKALLLRAGVSANNIVEYSDISEAVAAHHDEPWERMLVWGSFFTVSQALACLNHD